MIKRWININNGCYTYPSSWPSPRWTIILHPKFFPFRKKWAGRVVNMQLQYMRRIKCCWEKPRMGRHKNEYKLWKNSLNEKDDGYNIGTKKMVGNKRALDLAWSAERWMSRFSYWIPSADLWRWRPSAVTIYLGAQDMKSHRFCQALAAPVLRPGSARNESSTAGSHSSGGWQCYRYSLIPTSCNTQFALFFFSLNAVGHVWASASSRTDDDEGSRRFWRMRMTTLKIHLQ
jgi:hypothetical protein